MATVCHGSQRGFYSFSFTTSTAFLYSGVGERLLGYPVFCSHPSYSRKLHVTGRCLWLRVDARLVVTICKKCFLSKKERKNSADAQASLKPALAIFYVHKRCREVAVVYTSDDRRVQLG